MNINTEIWGEPLAYFTQYNNRTGATDLNDPDFEDYPPFTYNNINSDWSDPSGTTYSYTIRAGIAANKFTPNEKYPDYSIAYVGMYNPDLPQCNIQCIGQTPTTASGTYAYEPCFMTDPNDVLPIAFISNRAYRSYRAVSTYTQASRDFKNPFATSNQKRLYAPYSSDNASQWNQRNISFDMAYWRSIGIRSVIGSIYVKYVDAELNSNGIPVTTNYQPVTLKYYKTQSDEWKTAHPICAAYMALTVRTNTNGTYRQYNAQDSIMPDLTVGIKVNKNIVTSYTGDVPCISPSQMINGDGNNQAYLPIFGLPTAATGAEGGVLAQIGITPSGGGMNTGNYPMFIGTNYGEIHHGTSTATYQRTCWITANDSTGNLEWIMRGAAAYGLFFTDGSPSDYPDVYDENNDIYRWVNPAMCLGTVDENGHTNGDYTRGMDNPTAPNFTWLDTTQSPYNPALPPSGDPTIYDTETGFNVLGGVANCNKMYATTAANIMMLAKALSTALNLNAAAADPLPPLDYSIQTFLTNNPLDCVVSLRKYPTADLTDSTSFEPIEFGAYSNSSVLGVPFVKSYEKVDFNFSVAARNALYAHFGDFRDYEPYTHAELIVPFCGTVAINPAEFIGHDINVHMIIDYITGSCTAYIAADGLVITSISGSCAVDVPLSGIQQATLESQRVNAVMNRKSAEVNAESAIVGGFVSSVGFAGSLMGDNAIGAISSGAGLLQSVNRFQQADISYQKADYDVKHMQVPYKQVSAGSPIAGTVIEHKCRLIIYRPVMDDNYNAEQYAKTVGFACLMNGTIESLGLTGLTVANINTDGLILTETEKQMIIKAFASGVII